MVEAMELCGGWLRPGQLARWKRLGHATISITLDTYSHAIPAMQEEVAALLSLCQAWELAQAAYDDLTWRGVIVESSRADRELVRNPSMMAWGAATEKVTQLLGRFGMTPVDRARFDIPKAPPAGMTNLQRIRLMTARN